MARFISAALALAAASGAATRNATASDDAFFLGLNVPWKNFG